MNENEDRFGTPAENIEAAKIWATKFPKKYPYYTHVPTRKEIATLPSIVLKEMLVGWMEHSPTVTIPSRIQISLLQEVLQSRPDAGELTALLDMCSNYISER